LTVIGGINLSWDGDSHFVLLMPENLKGSMCGLCGDSNGEASDEMIVGSVICMDAFKGAEKGSKASYRAF
jgi:hypothetical protein